MGALSFNDLPYVPKITIMRYLTNGDLAKMQQTCRSMKPLVKRSLVKRNFLSVNVTRKFQTNPKTVIYRICVFGRRAPFPTAHYLWNKSDPHSRPFVSWFAETFRKSSFETMTFHNFVFDKEEVTNIEELWRENEIGIKSVQFHATAFGSKGNSLKILMAARPEYVEILQDDVTDTHVLFTKSFMKFISSLKGFRIRKNPPYGVNYEQWSQKEYKFIRLPTIPVDNFEELPSAYLDTSFAFIIHFDVVKSVIQKLRRNSALKCSHMVSLAGQFRDNDAMLEALGLPETETSIDAKGRIEIYGEEGQKVVCSLRKTGGYSEVSDAYEWRIISYSIDPKFRD